MHAYFERVLRMRMHVMFTKVFARQSLATVTAQDGQLVGVFLHVVSADLRTTLVREVARLALVDHRTCFSHLQNTTTNILNVNNKSPAVLTRFSPFHKMPIPPWTFLWARAMQALATRGD